MLSYLSIEKTKDILWEKDKSMRRNAFILVYWRKKDILWEKGESMRRNTLKIFYSKRRFF